MNIRLHVCFFALISDYFSFPFLLFGSILSGFGEFSSTATQAKTP